MSVRIALLSAVVVALFAFNAPASTSFEAAKDLGRADSTNPAYEDWYLNEMRPAFSTVFQRGLGQCAHLASGNELTSLGIVFTVRPDGSVGRFFASRGSKLAACLETQVRGTTFPPSPKEEFYFGLDLAPPPSRA